MKKFLSLLLAVIMLLGCIPAMAEAGTFTANADKHMITAYKGEDENLVVPASVDGVPTPIINWQTINGAKKAVTLTLEEGITQIRSNNIASLNITQLTLPSTLEVIANNNIYQTDKLTEVTVPAAVSYVGTLTFSYCDVLTKVTFTGLCPVFGPRTFVSTAKDLVVYVPDDQLDAYKAALPEGLNIQSSGKNAVDARVRVSESDFEFDAATGTIKKYNGTASYIEIPATIGGVQVKTIGQKAFYQHPYMTVVIIPEGVETLEMYSIFAGSGLYRVELPSTLKTIGNNALWGAELDSVKLPEGLEKIGDGAFTNGMYSKVEELIIPDSVTSIGKEAFKGCTPIKIIIGANVQSLAEGAFGALNYVEEVVIRNTNGMTIDPKAFQSSKKGATITLMDGITEEVYNSYVEQLAVAYENATVNQPELAAAFPTLDAEAGAPFIGNWNAVAVTDGTDFYGMDLLGMSMSFVLNADGTGSVDMDVDSTAGGWYVADGTAIFAPILEEGGQPDPEEAMPLTLDENGRMCLDLMGLIVLMEKEGVEYAVPAIPEKPWPELDADKAQYYVGTWDAVSYIVDGETYPAELVGPTTLILNADGTAQMTEGEEEAYELRWYAESYSAYVGPAMSALVEIYFDMNGNLEMLQDGSKIVFAPHVDAKVIEGADELLGDWYDDVGNKLTLVNDGTLTHTYSFDGWVDTYAWDVVDGAAVVTEGPWSGLPITLENGILIITNDEGIFQIFSRDGDLSAYYGEDDEEYDMPEAQPIGVEGEPYFGAWNGEMFGMEVILTLNPDGTCAMEMMGEAEPGVWSIVDGKANIMGDELYIDDGGSLVYAALELVFTKAGGAAPSGPETALGTWEDKYKTLYVNEDGTIELVYKSDGYTSRMTWEVMDGNAVVMEGLWENMPLTAENGVLTLTDGSYVAEFTRVGEAPAVYVGPGMGAAPAVPSASAGTGIDYVPSVADDFIGGWICTADPGMQILILEDEVSLIDGDGCYSTTWAVVNGAAEIDGMTLYITDNYTVGILDMYGEQATFERGYVEKPKTSAPAPSDGGNAGTQVSSELQAYVGTWHLCYLATGGLEGDLRSMGLTGKLVLNADGTGVMTGLSDESGSWYDDEGQVRFGDSGMPIFLLDGGFLRYGTEMSGYMVFSQNESATWSPAPAATPVPAPTAAPAAPAAPNGGNVERLNVKFVCKTYTSAGYTMDASMLGAEYALVFHDNGMADFTMAGFTANNLPYTVTAEGVYAINYYGTMFNCTPTDAGFDMDFYGTMMMHFVPAE